MHQHVYGVLLLKFQAWMCPHLAGGHSPKPRAAAAHLTASGEQPATTAVQLVLQLPIFEACISMCVACYQ